MIGVVYLFYFLVAFLAPFLTRGLVVRGDAAATANNILAHEISYRSGLAVDLIATSIYIAVTALFYRLFGPVNRSLSLLAAFFSLAGCAVQIMGGVFQLAPFFVLRDSSLPGVFKAEQLQALAQLCLMLHAQAFKTGLVLFACYDLLLGYLIFRSTFLPRFLGVIMMCAGVGWLTFVWPPLGTALSFGVLPLGALAEVLLMIWLLVRGVNVPGWREKAAAEQAGGA